MYIRGRPHFLAILTPTLLTSTAERGIADVKKKLMSYKKNAAFLKF